jgi:Ni,Fe-hydrogenase I large subunit
MELSKIIANRVLTIQTMSKEIRQMIDKVKNFKQFVNENVNDNVYAFFNTKTNEIVGRGLTSDMIDYHLYKKNKIKDKYLKVIKNPSDDEVRVTDSGSLVFKDGYEPQFLGYNY